MFTHIVACANTCAGFFLDNRSIPRDEQKKTNCFHNRRWFINNINEWSLVMAKRAIYKTRRNAGFQTGILYGHFLRCVSIYVLNSSFLLSFFLQFWLYWKEFRFCFHMNMAQCLPFEHLVWNMNRRFLTTTFSICFSNICSTYADTVEILLLSLWHFFTLFLSKQEKKKTE